MIPASPTPDVSDETYWRNAAFQREQQQPLILQSRSFEGSPCMTSFGSWAPLLDGMTQTVEQKLWGMQSMTDLESLHVEDMMHSASKNPYSPSASSSNSATAACAFASLPAWNSTCTLAPASTVHTDEDDEAPDEAWLKAASGKSLRRGGRRVCVSSATPVTTTGVAPLSPGAVAAAQATWQRPLRPALSAPELQHSRSSSSQLDDILEAMDCDAAAGSSERTSTGAASPNATSTSAASTSTASGSAMRESLLQRRSKRQGVMPAPMPVSTTLMTGSLSSGPTYAPLPNESYSGLQHSRSATLTISHNWGSPLLTQQAMAYTTPFASAREESCLDFGKHTPLEEQVANAPHAAFAFGSGDVFDQQQPLSNTSIDRRPSSAASLQSSNGLQTPVTPMHPLAPAPMSMDACSAWPSPLGVDINFASYGLPAPYSRAARLSNSLGLSSVPLPTQRQLPSVDAASFAQVYGSAQVASAATAQQTQSLLQLHAQSAHLAAQQQQATSSSSTAASLASPTKQRSSPNLRVGSPRKIASNRRVVSGDGRPRRSTVGGGGIQTIPLPPVVGRQRKKTVGADSAPAAFKTRAVGEIAFVNYGIEDADELCAAVAPSGSYKIPLRGYGSEEAADAAALAERAATAAARRMGPRWEERKEPSKTKTTSPKNQIESGSEDRSVKRRKSVASLKSSSPPASSAKSPTLTATRKVNRKQSRATMAQ